MLPKLEKFIIILIFLISYFGVIYHPDQPIFIGEFNNIDGSIYAARFIDVLVSIIIFWMVSFHLIPAHLEKKKIGAFVIFSLLILGFACILEYGLDYVVLNMFNLPTGPNEFSDKILMYPRRITYPATILPGNIFIYILGFLYGLSRDWIATTRRQNQLVYKKMQADIDFLRSQVNPHFFFNALNNIYAITRKNQDKEAGNAIMKLSAMMRYMIYESNVEQISIQKEIENIENYIEIARLKYAKNDPINIQIHSNGCFEEMKIAPLLLIPFVENAFKHGINSYGEGYIYINIELEEKVFSFHVKNSKYEIGNGIKKHSGIGLENVKKRLELLYPQRYSLQISNTEDSYSAQLEINLEA